MYLAHLTWLTIWAFTINLHLSPLSIWSFPLKLLGKLESKFAGMMFLISLDAIKAWMLLVTVWLKLLIKKKISFETTSQMMFVMSSIKKIPNFILIWQKEHGYHGHFLFLIGYFFLAHLAKGKVSFCHHLASVVCRPSYFNLLLSNHKANWPEIW